MRIQHLAARDSSYRKYMDCYYYDTFITEGEVLRISDAHAIHNIGRLMNRIAAL